MKPEEAIRILETESCYECTWGCESPTKCDCPDCNLKNSVKVAIEALKERPHGEWIESKERKGHFYCSECVHQDASGKWRELFDFKYNFCPNCGADMRKEGG